MSFLSWRIKSRTREKKEDASAGTARDRSGCWRPLALFGVDYFTSYYYATGEMMSALHPYGLQSTAYIAVAVIAFANFAFGVLYMYSLGTFNEGGGSYTASMRYLWPTLSLIVAITLIQDYVLTIVVSALSGGDQLLSILEPLRQELAVSLCAGGGRWRPSPGISPSAGAANRRGWCSP